MQTTLSALVDEDKDLPARSWRINVLEQFRTSAIYDHLQVPFYTEKNETTNEYIPLLSRRPSVRYGLPMIIVNDSTSLLFSESHFPAIKIAPADDGAAMEDKVEEVLNGRVAAIIKEAKVRETFLEAAVRGSVGSVAILFRILKARVFLKVMSTQFLTPEYDPEEPDKLLTVTERYKVKGETLRAMGYPIKAEHDAQMFWFQRQWTKASEDWYMPWPVTEFVGAKEYPANTLDKGRTVPHGLGFCPIVWIRNLPGGDDVDGACTFEPALSNSVEMDYQLSQAGRGLRYSSDPTLLIKEPAYQEGGPLVKNAANAMIMSREGDAKLIEINGSGAAAVEAYVRQIREISLELCGGNRASSDKLSAAQSGRAMELMNQGLIWLADKMRTSYGEGGLLELITMLLRASMTKELKISGKVLKPKSLVTDADAVSVVLKWPPWYAPTHADHQAQALAIQTYRAAGVLSRETAIHHIAHDFDIEDVADEMDKIRAEQGEEDKRAAANAQAQAIPAAIPKPGDAARKVVAED